MVKQLLAVLFVAALVAISSQSMDSAVQMYGYWLLMLGAFAYIDRKKRSAYPLLLMMFIYRTMFTLTAFFFIDNSLVFLFLVGINEVMFLWIFSKYYKSDVLKSFVRAQISMPNLHHYYWMLGLVAVNAFYKLAAGFEVLIYMNFRHFFEDSFIPFFFTTGDVVTTGIRFVIDFLVMAVVLKASRVR